MSDLVAKARGFYVSVGVRPDHPNAADFGAYFDRIWRAQGRRPELDSAEEQLGYVLARQDYVDACRKLARHRRLLDRRHRAACAYAAHREALGRRVWGEPVPDAWLRAYRADVSTPPVMRPVLRPGGGRPAGRPARRGGDSGDSDSDSGLADDLDSDPPGASRAIRRARARAPPLPH
ncbi:MAG: hypothetical protein ACXVSF_06480 [Solirubrobacteraceae bacterium]